MAPPTTTATSRLSFLRQFEILISSGIGVILVHAREPHRVCEALHAYADSRKRDYKEWNVRDGWVSWPIPEGNEVTKPDKGDGTKEQQSALYKIQDVGGDGTKAWKNGIFAMVYPHFGLKTATFIQCLKIYAREFNRTKQRLVLIVPEGYTLPKELENDIPILTLELPKRDELREIYQDVIVSSLVAAGKLRTIVPYNAEQVEEILNVGAGMTEVEFSNAIARACIANKSTFAETPLNQFLATISESKTEVVKRSETLELLEPVPLNEVGGLEVYIDWATARKVTYTPEFQAFCGGRDKAKGAMLIGPPGCGKTLLGSVSGTILGVPAFLFSIDKVFNKMVGDTEQRTRDTMDLLEAMAPCVCVVDEVDKAGIDPRGGGGDSGTNKRVMGIILKRMQTSKAPIYWLLTANRIDNLPAELLRKGRLDEVFSVQPPNDDERRQIMRIHLAVRNQNPDEIPDLEVAVAASVGYVSAELESAVKEAVINSFISSKLLTGADIVKELKTMKPLSIAFKDDFEMMRKWAEDNARPASLDTKIRSRRRNSSVEPADAGATRSMEMN